MSVSSLAKVLTWIDTVSFYEAVIELREDSLLKTKSLEFVQELRQKLEELAVEYDECLIPHIEKRNVMKPNLDNYSKLMKRLELITTTNFEECDNWVWVKLIENNDVDRIDLLLWLGRDANSIDKYDRTTLYFASALGQFEIVRLFVNNKVNVNISDTLGDTALSIASAFGHSEIVKFLIDAGADINSIDHIGQTSLIWAVHHGHLEVVRLLVDNGAKINIRDNDGQTAFILAVLHDKLEIVQLLLDGGADINLLYEDGISGFYFASMYGYLEIAELLLNKGVIVYIHDINELLALNRASREDRSKMIQLLLDIKNE
jgi:ankyrin repeat protein